MFRKDRGSRCGKTCFSVIPPGDGPLWGVVSQPKNTEKSTNTYTRVFPATVAQGPGSAYWTLTSRQSTASRKRLLCSDMDSGPNSAYAPSEKRCGMQELMHASVCIDPWSVVHNRGEEWELQLGIAMPGQCPHSAQSVPTQCPLQCPHSAHW